MPNQTVMSFSIKLPYKTRCQIPECQVAKNDVTKISFDEKYSGVFCGTPHAKLAMDRWQEKVQKGIKPGQPYKPEAQEDEGENIYE